MKAVFSSQRSPFSDQSLPGTIAEIAEKTKQLGRILTKISPPFENAAHAAGAGGEALQKIGAQVQSLAPKLQEFQNTHIPNIKALEEVVERGNKAAALTTKNAEIVKKKCQTIFYYTIFSIGIVAISMLLLKQAKDIHDDAQKMMGEILTGHKKVVDKTSIDRSILTIIVEQQRLQIKYNNSFSGYRLAAFLSRGPGHLKKMNALEKLKLDLMNSSHPEKKVFSAAIVSKETEEALRTAYLTDSFLKREPEEADENFKNKFIIPLIDGKSCQ
jgi:hypothetical protein